MKKKILHDFYYSKKQAKDLLDIGDNIPQNKGRKYTEAVLKGEKPFGEYDDYELKFTDSLVDEGQINHLFDYYYSEKQAKFLKRSGIILATVSKKEYTEIVYRHGTPNKEYNDYKLIETGRHWIHRTDYTSAEIKK